MLRKCTLFFDPSLKYVGHDDTSSSAFDLARQICAEFMETAQMISFAGDDEKVDENNLKHNARLVEKFVGAFPHPGISFPEEWARNLAGVIMRTYRIECIFCYPSESDLDEDVGHHVRYRRLSLRMRFLAKNERKPFHAENFVFSRYDGKLIGD